MASMTGRGLALAAGLGLLACGGGVHPSIPSLNPVPPVPTLYVTVSPLTQSVKVGQTVTFTCEAVGAGPLTYQWTRNGVPIQGASGRDLLLPSVTLDEDGGVFRCLITDAHGALVASAAATLQVTIALATVNLQGIQITLPDGPALLPGQSLPLVIAATPTSGPVLTTVGRGAGKVSWDNYQLTPSLVTVNESGLVTLSADPRVSAGGIPQVQAAVVGQPAVTASLQLPVRYNGRFTADFSGATGSAGFSGSDGFPGMSGAMGSCTPDSQQAGGNGGDGGDGGPGGDGGAGGPGGAIQAWVTVHPGTDHLLEVKASAQGRTLYFLIDPNGGSLALNCDGGLGGPGGSGGRGGSGGSGGYGCPDGSSGRSGSDGSSGWDGPGGNGGSITVTVDPQAQPLLAALTFSNHGAPRGGLDGPAPVVQVAPVAPLW